MCSVREYGRFAPVGFPIRTSPDQCLYTAPRGFSQCPTSFFGTWRLGIHRKPLVAFLRDPEKSSLLAPSIRLHTIHLVRFSASPSEKRAAFRPHAVFRLLVVLLPPRQLRLFGWLPSRVTTRLHSYAPGGDDGTRTRDIRLAKAALSQLSYIPAGCSGLDRIRTCDPCVISTVL